ncbi:response regulator transcription factor [Actinophytocola sp.]|uniref:response regulator transcription factor n=1 Tax=Actinophytocola sp. TaxID=1872138 RepID=UPI002ED6198D
MDTEVADRPVLRVVVADDQPVVRAGLTAVLGGTGEMEVVASSPDGREAVRDTLVHRPDVLVLDLRLRELSGEAVIRDVLQHAPETGILVFSAMDTDLLLTARRAGARGYLPKNSPDGQIVRAVERVAAGESVCPDVERRDDIPPFNQYPFPELTAREREVLALLAAGLPNPAIARELHLAPKTVSNHISNIYAKLGLADRYQAIMQARAAGLGRANTE